MTEIRDSKEYIDAYAEYIKTNDDTECRAILSSAGDPDGVPVPTVVYDIVKNAWEKDGIMSLVKKSYLKGILSVGFEVSGDEAAYHMEGDEEVTEENLVIGTVQLIPISIKKWVDRVAA